MIEVNTSNNHVVSLRLAGKIATADITRWTQAAEAAFKQAARISFYVEISEFGGITKEALIKDIQYELGMLKQMDRIYRLALVTEEEWIAAMVRFAGRIFPQVQLRVFEPKEKDVALAWASEVPSAAQVPVASPTPGVRMIATTNPKVLAFEMDGHMTAKDAQPLAETLQAAFEKHGTVRLLNRFKKFDGFDWTIVQEKATLRMKLSALRHVERYAVVGGPEWVEGLLKLVNPLFKVELRHFPAEEEAVAWEWMGAKPAGGK